MIILCGFLCTNVNAPPMASNLITYELGAVADGQSTECAALTSAQIHVGIVSPVYVLVCHLQQAPDGSLD